MNVLIISDDPERESFRQILRLKGDIENLLKKQVDLITISPDGIFLNQKLMTKKLSEIITTIEKILKEKTYSTLIISLRLKHLKFLFTEKINILDLIKKTSPKATTFIFGAKSILKFIEQRERVFFYSRQGVAKLTQEFKNATTQYIKSQLGRY